MTGLGPIIHAFSRRKDGDARVKPAHDASYLKIGG
jgi:hypothetical protein